MSHIDFEPVVKPAPGAWLMAPAGGWRRLRFWSSRVTLSVLDQGFVSGGHFAINILLIRSLAPSEYGAFAVAFAILLLAAGLHGALILEPMGVVGPTRYAERLPEYLGAAVWIHAGLSLPVSAGLLLAAAGAAARLGELAPAMGGLALSAPFILLFWFFRRACYLETKPMLALEGSVLYVLLLLAGTAALWRFGRVSSGAVFLLMGAAALAVSLRLWWRLRVPARNALSAGARAGLADVVRRHWDYARWSLGTTLLYWLASSIYLPVVGALAGLEAVAAFRATDNLLLPMSQVLTALGLLLLPWVTAQARLRRSGYLRRMAVRTSLLAGVPAAIYGLGILALGARLTRLFYGSDYYASCLPLVPYLGAAVVFRAVGDTGFGTAARAAGRPDIGFWATVAAAAVTLTLGLALVARYGAAGAAAGWMASSAASCLAYLWLFRRQVQ